MNVNLKELLEMTGNGVFCLLNEQDRKIDIRSGVNLIRAIQQLVTSIKGNAVQPIAIKKDIEKLELVILEKNVSNLGLCHKKWMNTYTNLGYELYRTKPRASLSLVISIDYIPLFKDKNFYFVVKLVGDRRHFVVGIFNNNEEMQEFTLKHYPNSIVNDIRYSSNELTTSYLKITRSSTKL